jgi:cold shock protein
LEGERISKVPEGTVKWYDAKKGFGFITRTDTNEDVFVHWSGIQKDGFKSLEQNQRVTFDIITSDRGAKAENVKPA